MANRIQFTFEINDAGKVKVEGLTKEFVKLDTAINKVNADLRTQSGELNKTNKNLGQTADKTGLAGAALVEISRTISDSNYGFRAMANNISQLSTLLITLVATSGGVVKGFKNLMKAFAGPLGLIVLLNAVIARFEFLELNAMKAKDSVDDLSKSTKDTGADLEVFVDLIDRGNLSNDELQRTLFSITKRYKDLNPEVDENGRLTDDSRRAIDNKIKSLEKLAKAQAIRVKLEELESDQLDFNLKRQQAIDEASIVSANDRVIRITNTGKQVLRSEQETIDIVNRRIEATRKSYESEGKALQERRENLLKYLEDTDSANEAFGMVDRERETALTMQKLDLIDLEVDYTLKADAKIIKSDNAKLENKKKNIDLELMAVAELTNGLARFFGEQTAAGKAFAIATATIDTYVAANQVLSDKEIPTFLKIVTSAAIIANGLANVKRITEVDVTGDGRYGGARGRGQVPAQGQAPIFNVVGQSSVNQLGQTIASARSEPMRAYVVANDITNAQELENKIIQQSSLG